MEKFFWTLSDNSLQIQLMKKKADELKVPVDSIAEEWIDNFSARFRQLIEMGITELAEIEDRIYLDDGIKSNFADSVVGILTGVRDPRLTQ